ncbi:pilus assembly protein PilX [Psychrobacter aestuarii]|uniref:Pilus assembly protein PilX n=1 Tax=Psychrobacter aestuarii TaxID=556327 RepID=A0ABP3FA95_9GAMM|nr:pilus assembly protein PilX [Psychrobacter aestuarii]
MSTKRSTHMLSRPVQQQGAVLIVVLLFLILIVIAGALAVRQSTTDLKLSTSDQVNTLLLQSADNANQNIEQSVNGDSRSNIYTDMLSRSGPFGYFILDKKGQNNEYVFCFRPRDRFFNINKTTIRTPSGGSVLPNTTGYCNPSKPEDYVSSRNASMTQVNVSMTPPRVSDEAFNNFTLGQDTNKVSSIAYSFDVNSTAVLPAYGDTKVGSTNCFAQTTRPITTVNATDTLSGCMSSAGVPNTTVYQQVNVENQSLRVKCVNYGKGDGLLCTLPSN